MLYQLMKDELAQFGYSEFRYVSEGLQGYVVLAKESLTNQRFAIKGILVKDLNGIIDQKKQEQVQQEIKMLEQCRGSPNVSNLIKTIDGAKFTFLVLTECLGTLKELIESLPNNKLNELSAIKYCKDIAQGLYYIHSKSCIVNDLKFDNILIDYNGNAVISDFGFAQTLPNNSGYSMIEYVNKQQHQFLCHQAFFYFILKMGNFYFQAPECYDPKAFKDYQNEYKRRGFYTQINPSQRVFIISFYYTNNNKIFNIKKYNRVKPALQVNIQEINYHSQIIVKLKKGYIFYVMIQGFKSDLAFKKHIELPYDQNFQTFKYKKQIRYIIDGLTQFIPRQRLSVEEALIILKGIISYEFDLDSKFTELISQEIQEEANKSYKEIEFIQNFNSKYYPIFKNEAAFLQELQSCQDEIQKLKSYSENLEFQINSLQVFQVQAEQKIQKKKKKIKELQQKLAKQAQEICINKLNN